MKNPTTAEFYTASLGSALIFTLVIIAIIFIYEKFIKDKKSESSYDKNWVTEGFPNLETN